MKTKSEQEQSWGEYLTSSQVKNFMFYIMIMAVVALSVYVYFKIQDESIKCMSSPLTYGAAQLSSSNNASIQCSCYAQGSEQVLYFDKNNLTYATRGYVIP